MSLAGEAVVAIWHDIVDTGRNEFYWWHMHEHVPERVGIPGFLRGRRYIAEDGAPEFFTLYEVQNTAMLGGRDYLDRLNAPTEWTVKTVKYIINVARSLQQVRYSSGAGIGGHLLTMFFEIDSETANDADFTKQMTAGVLNRIEAERGICGVHFNQTIHNLSDIQTKERQSRGGGTKMPGWSLLIEATRRDDLDRVHQTHLRHDTLRKLGVQGDIGYGIYRLEYVCTNSEPKI